MDLLAEPVPAAVLAEPVLVAVQAESVQVALALPQGSAEGSLSVDTDGYGDAWYTTAAVWAYYCGILDDLDSFQPSSPCPRADIVTYLYRNFIMTEDDGLEDGAPWGGGLFVGTWTDLGDTRLSLTIERQTDDIFRGQIDFRSRMIWDFTGVYNAELDAIVYDNMTKTWINHNKYTGEDFPEVLSTNGEGAIGIIEQDGTYLYWLNLDENVTESVEGAALIFEFSSAETRFLD